MAAQMKVSEWLCKFTDSHAIQEAPAMAKLFKEHTGHDAPWYTVSAKQAARDIVARGKGGTLNTKAKVPLCYGYAMAEACAYKWTEGFNSWQTGLGFRFQTAVAALQKAGL